MDVSPQLVSLDSLVIPDPAGLQSSLSMPIGLGTVLPDQHKQLKTRVSSAKSLYHLNRTKRQEERAEQAAAAADADGKEGGGKGAQHKYPPFVLTEQQERDMEEFLAKANTDENGNKEEARPNKIFRQALPESDDEDDEEGGVGGVGGTDSPEPLPPPPATHALRKDARLDQKLQTSFRAQRATARYQYMLERRMRLPAFGVRDQLIDFVHSHNVVVICGETGCGKSTQVPQFILEDLLECGVASQCRVVCTQPRRLAAISLATRVAEEQADMDVGESVGYQVRFEQRRPRREGSVLYCTAGIVLQWLKHNPQLAGISHLILDEVHERSIQTDFLLASLRTVLEDNYNLKVILMSATINAEAFSDYFNGCPILYIPGETFFVHEYFLEDVVEMMEHDFGFKKVLNNNPEFAEFDQRVKPQLELLRGHYSFNTMQQVSHPYSEVLFHDFVAALVKYIDQKKPPGAILVFLPGWEDISIVQKLLDGSDKEELSYVLEDAEVIPLHSSLLSKEQQKVFQRPVPPTRKVVISTNIAETSITIDDIVYVVDCGRANVKRFNAVENLSSLDPEWISRANATQRKGRAGRCQEGTVYHLFTRARYNLLEEFMLPEIRRMRIEDVILSVKNLFTDDVRLFLQHLLDSPPDAAVELGIQTLQTMNALDNRERLTVLGNELANLPIDVQMGKMLLYGALLGCLDPVLSIAARLGNKDPFHLVQNKEEVALKKKKELAGQTESDHLLYVEMMRRFESALLSGCDETAADSFCQEFFLSRHCLERIQHLKKQLASVLFDRGFLDDDNPQSEAANVNAKNEQAILACVVAGMYPNFSLMYRTGRQNTLKMWMPQGNARMRRSVLDTKRPIEGASSYLTYFQVMQSSSGLSVFDASKITPMAMGLFGRLDGVEICRGRTRRYTDVGLYDMFVRVEWASEEHKRLVERVRHRLDHTVEELLLRPNPDVWMEPGNPAAEVFRSVIRFLSFHGK